MKHIFSDSYLNLRILLMVLVMSFSFSSCDEEEVIRSLFPDEVDIPITFAFTINDIAVPKDSDPNATNSFSRIASYDLLTNPNITDQAGTADAIKKIVITDAKYEYRNFSGNVDAVASGSFQFLSLGRDSPLLTTVPANVAAASATSELFPINNAPGIELNPGDGVIGVLYAGSTTANPVVFDTWVTVSATVTVSPDIDPL